VVERGGADESDDAVLGRDVGRRALEADGAKDAGHAHDRPTARLPHHSDLGPAAVEGPIEVNGHHLAPTVHRGLARRRGRAGDPGVVDGHIQPTERVDGGSNHRRALVRVGRRYPP
jgi:hypothetical protein